MEKLSNILLNRFLLILVSIFLYISNSIGQYLGGNSDGFATSSYLEDYAVINNDTQNADGGNADGACLSCNSFILLPIKLVSFLANCEEQYVNIQWSTLTEKDNDHFTIERTDDAMIWREIATIKGNGNSSNLINYSFTDKNPMHGINYYRLKQTDFNGKYEYSDALVVEDCNTDQTKLIVFPTPSSGTVKILYSGDKQLIRSTEIYDGLGKRIYYSDVYKSIIDLSDKEIGVYFLRLNLDNGLIPKNERIIIER